MKCRLKAKKKAIILPYLSELNHIPKNNRNKSRHGLILLTIYQYKTTVDHIRELKKANLCCLML